MAREMERADREDIPKLGGAWIVEAATVDLNKRFVSTFHWAWGPDFLMHSSLLSVRLGQDLWFKPVARTPSRKTGVGVVVADPSLHVYREEMPKLTGLGIDVLKLNERSSSRCIGREI